MPRGSAPQAPQKRAAAKQRRASRAPKKAPEPPFPNPWRAGLNLLWPETSTGSRVLGAVLVAAFLLRVYRLTSMFPILVDESIYLRWAEIIQHQGNWFISLLDGKQPLTYWILAVTRMVWDGDPLLSGRLVSVCVGLFTTVGIFAVGRKLHSEPAGLIAAALYAVFPLALLYDRLAYTEAFVNLFGVAIVLATLECFSADQKEGQQDRIREIAAGCVLGLAFFTKQTLLLFAFFPALAGLWMARRPFGKLMARLGVIYGIGAAFLALAWLATPEAPTLDTHDPLLHHRSFFISSDDLLADPFKLVAGNAEKLMSYAATYLSIPVVLACLAASAYLAWKRWHRVWLLLSVSVLPLLVQLFVLELMFPTRYPFPHFWPWLVVLAVGAVTFWREQARAWPAIRRKIALGHALVLIGGPFAYQAAGQLTATREFLHSSDAEGFLGSHGHVGFGISDAVDYLLKESKLGPFVLLTDPVWGPPSDAMFPYLNERNGIRVHEAWWTQLSGSHPILPSPAAQVDLIRSHYERLPAGVLDFSRVSRVFYVTDTYYYNWQAVKVRQPNAQLVASFPKPDGKLSIDVYRLK